MLCGSRSRAGAGALARLRRTLRRAGHRAATPSTAAVTLPAPPQRIIPIFASNVEIVASLGLADRIVGIEAYTRYPREVLDRPLVGGRLGFSVDAVVALKPDLVVVTPSRQAANQLIDPMERTRRADHGPAAAQRARDPGQHPPGGPGRRRSRARRGGGGALRGAARRGEAQGRGAQAAQRHHDHRPARQRPDAGGARGHLYRRRHGAGRRALRLAGNTRRWPRSRPRRSSMPIPTCCCGPAASATSRI